MSPAPPMAELTAFAVALGSNLGPREAHLVAAVAALRGLPGVEVERVSSWLETEPVGGPAGQGPYLNGVLTGRTSLGARELLNVLLAIETARGRHRKDGERDAPRTLDLDLLLHGNLVVDEPGMIIPHPRLTQREFVLAPLCEVTPELEIPPGGKSVRVLLAELRAAAALRGSVAGTAR